MSTKDGYFEMISTYFVKIYYNYLYDEAVKVVKNSSSTNTNMPNEYRSTLRAFKDGVSKDPKYYYRTIKDICQEFQKISPIMLVEFVDNVVKLFIPDQFHKDLMNEKLRDQWMYNIVIQMIDKFNYKINNIYVDKIIDEKQRNKELINILQDEFNNILEIIRTDIHIKLTNPSHTGVSMGTYEKLKKEVILLKEELEKSKKIKKDVIDKEQEIKNNIKQIEQLENVIKKLTKENKRLLTRVEELEAINGNKLPNFNKAEKVRRDDKRDDRRDDRRDDKKENKKEEESKKENKKEEENKRDDKRENKKEEKDEPKSNIKISSILENNSDDSDDSEENMTVSKILSKRKKNI